MFFYRDSNQKEIDLLVEMEGELHPVEIKLASNPDSRLVRNFKVLEGGFAPLGPGGLVCMSDSILPIDSGNALIPCSIL